MNTTLLETDNLPQPEYDLPALLMRLDANQIALWRCHPGIGLYPVTRLSPAMRQAITQHRDKVWHAPWQGQVTVVTTVTQALDACGILPNGEPPGN